MKFWLDLTKVVQNSAPTSATKLNSTQNYAPPTTFFGWLSWLVAYCRIPRLDLPGFSTESSAISDVMLQNFINRKRWTVWLITRDVSGKHVQSKQICLQCIRRSWPQRRRDGTILIIKILRNIIDPASRWDESASKRRSFELLLDC